ncbi:MAG TPA: CoA pyrophosphatase [Steroidobacteraceae bacterium]
MIAPAQSMLPALPPDWCARLRRGLWSEPDHGLERSRIGTGAAVQSMLPAHLTAAAVLVPIVAHPESPGLLLTVRAPTLRSHAGQISFPGGQVETGDRDLAAAALRETAEEIGISAAAIEPLGFLSDQIVRSGYRITPLVALLQPGFVLRPDSSEVAEVFELPLAFALAADNYRSRPGRQRGLEFEIWELPFGDRNIWGATAGILANLRDVLQSGA